MPLDRQSPARPAAALMDKAERSRLRERCDMVAHHPAEGWVLGARTAEEVLTVLDDLSAAIAERDAAVAVVRAWLRNYHDGIDDAATCDRLACRQAAAVVAAATERAR